MKIFMFMPLILLAGMIYVGIRLWKICPGIWLKIIAMALFMAGLAALVLAYAKFDTAPARLETAAYEYGNTWLMVLLYLFMAFLLLDILRLCGIIPKSFLNNSAAGAATVAIVIGGLFTYGYFHYMKKYVEEYEMETGKVSRPVRLVMVSDLHLGYHNRSGELARWIEKINSMKPDMVLCAGDIIDFSTKPLLEGGFAEEFRKLDAPIYTCLGNHDHYAGTGKAMEFFSDAGIITLTDSTLLFNSELRPTSDSDSAMLAVTGRDDYSSSRSRKSLDELMPKGRPFTIVLDHEPYRLEEAEKAGVDFQFSGHVHYGQVWPISWITRAIFEQAYGHLTKGGTEYYVTSGLGIWGAKIRIGTRSEYFVLDIKPASK